MADALHAVAPFAATAMTWGEEIYVATPITLDREPEACAVVKAGELAFRPM
jgi:hypothetical protein